MANPAVSGFEYVRRISAMNDAAVLSEDVSKMRSPPHEESRHAMNDALTRALARFALADHSFPELARTRALDAMTDCVACMLAGSEEALAKPLSAVVPSTLQADDVFSAVLLGSRRHAAPADAALYNGTLAHALDYDDTNHPAYAHPSAVLVAAMLAVAPMTRASGAELVTAYIVGFEVFGKLGRAMNTQHYKRGWHATSTFGTLVAAVAVGRLLKLTEQQMVFAIGIAASAASGLRANFGSMVKPLHAGYAARNGVLAALLAREGFDACGDALDHPCGYMSVFNAGIGFKKAPMDSLGQDLEILTPHGLALKPYPACGATHPGIEAALVLHRELAGAEIRSVRAGVCEMAFSPLIHVMPDTPLEGKFSLHYCVAAALIFGNVGLATFTPEKVADPRVRALIPKITMEVDERWRDESEFPTELTVETEDGRRLVNYVPLAMGKPERWFSAAQLRAKFEDCAGEVLGNRLDDVYDSLRALDDGRPAIEFCQSLSGAMDRT